MAKRYKANPAAITRYLVGLGFKKSTYHRSQMVRGWGTRTRGVRAEKLSMGEVVVWWYEPPGMGPPPQLEEKHREIFKVLRDRFGSERVTMGPKDRKGCTVSP